MLCSPDQGKFGDAFLRILQFPLLLSFGAWEKGKRSLPPRTLRLVWLSISASAGYGTGKSANPKHHASYILG